MQLTLGFSPCPNDTFIFDALVHQKVDAEGLTFNYLLADVEELNQKAFNSELDVTKVSFNAFLSLTNRYQLLDAGSALGYGAGPLVISKHELKLSDLPECSIAIPGFNTTANLLLSIAIPEAKNRTAILFSSIEQAVADGKFDAGLIIHESRFTYEQKGLRKIADLGEFWESITGSPIPLGGIVARREFHPDIHAKLNRAIRRSIEYAFAHHDEPSDFVRCNAREMNDEVMKKHISLYVNDFSLSLGTRGRKAVDTLFEMAIKCGVISSIPDSIYA